jgi:DNA-binding NtrC family response regulator
VLADENAPTEARIEVAPTADSLRYTILVITRDGAFTYVCPGSGTITIGRGADADIRIDDVKASRRHAIVHIGDVHESCAIEDCGSLNSTRLGERTLAARERADFGVGERVTIGATTLILQRGTRDAPPQRLRDPNAFRTRIDAEHARASRDRTNFGLLRVDLDPRSSVSSATGAVDLARKQRLERTFDDCLRAGDVVGTVGPDHYGVLLPATMPEVVEGLAGQLRRELNERGFVHVMHVAFYPRDGESVDDLSMHLEAVFDEPPEPKSVTREGGFERRIAPMIDRIANGEINVLILGETGVGKEVLSRSIHERSHRAKKPLVCLNCAALSESLLESELFGHEKGAFTGATQAKPGLLESAEGGSVFLDEVGEMPLSLQAKLLRVLEQREVLRVGSLRPRPIDVRFIAATNRDLDAEILAGRFRQDLFFRLNGIALSIPPLRERLDELEPLAHAFIEQACARTKRPTTPRLSSVALEAMRAYGWPGNIRELRNVMERAVLLCVGDAITLDVLPPQIAAASSSASYAKANAGPASPKGGPTRAAPSREEAAAETAFSQLVERIETGAGRPADERDRVVAALAACNGNQTNAAKLLGVSRRTLISRIEEYDLPRPRTRLDDDER